MNIKQYVKDHPWRVGGCCLGLMGIAVIIVIITITMSGSSERENYVFVLKESNIPISGLGGTVSITLIKTRPYNINKLNVTSTNLTDIAVKFTGSLNEM